MEEKFDTGEIESARKLFLELEGENKIEDARRFFEIQDRLLINSQ